MVVLGPITVSGRSLEQEMNRKIVNLTAIESGKAEMVYLAPGDQVFVSGKGFSIAKVFDIMLKASSLRYLVGSPL